MNRYQPFTFRPAFGIAAAAMSAITLAVLVVLPVSLATACDYEWTTAAAPAAAKVATERYRVDVVATTVRAVMLEPVTVVARRGPQAS